MAGVASRDHRDARAVKKSTSHAVLQLVGPPSTRMGKQSWGPLLADFYIHQQASNNRPLTIRGYRYRLLEVADRHRDPAAVTTDHLVVFLANPDWGPDSKKTSRSAYRAFFGWAHRTGRLEVDPSTALPTIRAPKRLPRPVPEHIFDKALAAAPKREAFMLRLGRFAGLRDCEIALVHQRDWDGLWLQVYGKGGKERLVAIVESTLVAQLNLLRGWAFPNRYTGQPLTSGHVCVLLSRALPGQFTGHQLRHSYGTVSVEGTKDIQAVARQMGHGSLDTTQLYSLVSQARLVAVATAASDAA